MAEPTTAHQAFGWCALTGANPKGYAAGFEGLIEYVNAFFPANEAIGAALRTTPPLYPPAAIRELIANALIHQDFSITGSGPIVEVFDDGVEISNPGMPIIDPDRLVEAPPRSRNEALASLMRRMGTCEERGSGWDKVAFHVEFHQLPAPEVIITADTTRTPRPLVDMTPEDNARATRIHHRVTCGTCPSGRRGSARRAREVDGKLTGERSARCVHVNFPL